MPVMIAFVNVGWHFLGDCVATKERECSRTRVPLYISYEV